MELIGCDIQQNVRMYNFTDHEAMKRFMEERIEPNFYSAPLGIPYGVVYDFETLTEYNGFLTEV